MVVTAVGIRGVHVLPRVDQDVNKDRDLAQTPHLQMEEQIVLHLENRLKLKNAIITAQVRHSSFFFNAKSSTIIYSNNYFQFF